MPLAYLPSPNQGVWYLGFFPVRAYALFILLGIVVAVWLGDRRYTQRGGEPGVVLDIAAWAVPFGIIGGRLYHVITSWQLYFGSGGQPVRALYIWEGGLGIWGAIALGALGAWIAARRRGLLLPPLADALAPGIVLAQAIGRWGNYFNNELYGSPTTLPWGLRVHEWDQSLGRAVTNVDGIPIWKPGAYHPTFLYESLWNVGVAVVIILLDRRLRLGHARVFALYVALYTAGRFWIEELRIDDANVIFGQRLNVWTAIIVFVAAVIGLVISHIKHPGRELVLTRAGAVGAAPAGDDTEDDEDDEDGELDQDGESDRRDATDAADDPAEGDAAVGAPDGSGGAGEGQEHEDDAQTREFDLNEFTRPQAGDRRAP